MNQIIERCEIAEKQLVGHLLISPWQIRTMPDVDPSLFVDPRCRSLYAAMLSLSDDGQQITPTLLIHRLRDLSRIDELIAQCVETAPDDGTQTAVLCETLKTEALARLEYESHITRAKAIERGSRGAQGLDRAIRDLTTMANEQVPERRITLYDAIESAVERIKTPPEDRDCELYPTGIEGFDRLVGGLPRGLLTIVGAPPAMGKSLFFANMISNMGQMGRRIYASILEDRCINFANRIIARHAMIDSQRLHFGREMQSSEIQKIEQEAKKIRGKNIIMNDAPRQTTRSIRRAVAREIANEGCDILIVDHLGQMTDPKNAYASTSENTQELAEIAKEFNIAVVAGCQVNRSNRGQMPTKKDLRDSGRIEEVARLIMMLYRPAEDDPNDDANLMQVNVDKNTNGRKGVIDLQCNLATMSVW